MTAEDAPIACILSNARSGSTALRSALAAPGQLKDFGEIFHNDRELTALPFLSFLEGWRDPLLALTNWNECLAISRAYVQQLKLESFGQRPLIDIKHNAWGFLKPLWQFPHDEPPFMTALKAEQTVFVQLKRENLADQVISYLIARETQRWHSQITAADVPERLAGHELDLAQVKRLCSLFRRAEALTEELLSDYSRRITLTYESTFSNGVLSAEAAKRLSAAIGLPVEPMALPMRPNAVVKRDIIANYDAVQEIAALAV